MNDMADEHDANNMADGHDGNDMVGTTDEYVIQRNRQRQNVRRETCDM